MDNKEKDIINIEALREEQEFIKGMRTLTKDQQNAIMWLLFHIDILDIIDSGKILSQEEIDRWLERAVESNDLYTQVLLNYKVNKDRERLEKQTEQPHFR